ncbi:MAG: feruloyl-CoA synthase [Granulosicoccus sp.]
MSLKYRAHDVIQQKSADGSILLQAREPLGEVAFRTTDWLDHWADATPDAVFLAERSGAGWREESFRSVQQQSMAIAGGLLSLGLEATTPIMIISGNSVDHGLLALAAQYVGIPVVPVAEQYALIPGAHKQLDFVASLVKPGMVFAEDGQILADALQRDSFRSIHKVVSRGVSSDTQLLSHLRRLSTDISSATAGVGPQTVAKILLTSGSTSTPKGVPTTHHMMCANQAQIAHGLTFLAERPPVILDWLPWNHVFGGSHNFNLMLANGGSLYIDAGKPAPQLIGKTLENLRLKTGTMSFNVPAGFAMIRDELRKDADLCQRYFEELDMLFYAGASLPQDVWADLEAMANKVRGDMPLFTSSWGLTETAPAHLLQHQQTQRSGVVGVPLPGATLKLVPDADGRYEARVRGPNVFAGYLNQPQATAEAFDDEGYFKTGDAMMFVDAENPNLGLKFDGRLSEEFKLLSGTWVRAATLRLNVLQALGELAADIVITGADRQDIGVLVIPSASTRAAVDAQEIEGALIVPSLQEKLRKALAPIGQSGSTRIVRAMILAEPPSMADGEMTAKGSMNFSRLLDRRKVLLERLYDDKDVATVMM